MNLQEIFKYPLGQIESFSQVEFVTGGIWLGLSPGSDVR